MTLRSESWEEVRKHVPATVVENACGNHRPIVEDSSHVWADGRGLHVVNRPQLRPMMVTRSRDASYVTSAAPRARPSRAHRFGGRTQTTGRALRPICSSFAGA